MKPMAMAAVAAGADGIMVEVHPDPDTAKYDGQQSLTPDNYLKMVNEVLSLRCFMDEAGIF